MTVFGKGVIFVVTNILLNIVASELTLRDVRLRFYYGATSNVYTEFNLTDATQLLHHPSFHRHQSTIIYIPGWNEKMHEAKTLLAIVDSYLTRRMHNMVVLNYEKLAANFYPIVVKNTKKLGRRLADALRHLYYSGLNPDRLHCMGFSIGAHICGEVGRALRPHFIIPRITGFDPGYLMYYGTSEFVELNRADARFVDIIHTDAGISGGPTSTGHADFYPNGGKRPQPGCGSVIWQFLSLAVGGICPILYKTL